jgi:sugar phosphate isomerase/epimerase
MKLGICTSVENARAARSAGAEFIEENVQRLLQGEMPDDQWTGATRTAGSALPILAANSLLPGKLRITGPAVDRPLLRDYMQRVLARAQKLGIKTLVFGSGKSRQVPEDFDRAHARKQIVEFASMSADLAQRHNVLLVVEPLCARECNILNSVTEAMEYVKEVHHPNFQCLVDSYHWWTQQESLQSLADAAPWIKHVHVAERDTRLAPGESGSDYRPMFRILKQGGYDGPISVEATGFTDLAGVGPRVMDYLRAQWKEA